MTYRPTWANKDSQDQHIEKLSILYEKNPSLLSRDEEAELAGYVKEVRKEDLKFAANNSSRGTGSASDSYMQNHGFGDWLCNVGLKLW